MSDDRDTRDRVIRLEEKIDRALPILEDLHAAHLKAQGGWAVGKALATLARQIPAGAIGAAGVWLLQHSPVR